MNLGEHARATSSIASCVADAAAAEFTSLRRLLGRWAFSMARSHMAGPLVRLIFARASFLLPVSRIVQTPHVVVFWHPRPSWQRHLLLVPKASIASYTEVNASNARLLRELLQLAPVAARLVEPPLEEYGLIMNGGALQDVRQLHFHLVSPMDPVDRRSVHMLFRPTSKEAPDAYIVSMFHAIMRVATEYGLERRGFSLITTSDDPGTFRLVAPHS
jgi:histidine triad (HIT) family protein